MTAYAKVAQALVTAGYLSETDVEAAAAVLADGLTVASAQDAKAAALADEDYQEDVIADAAGLAQDDAWDGDYQDAAYQQDRITNAEAQQAADEEILAAAQGSVAAAYADAAAALVTAELIDEANLEAVAGVIADVWIVEED
jgi:hypothetical protein